VRIITLQVSCHVSYIAIRVNVKIPINVFDVRFRMLAHCKCRGTYCNLTHLSECQYAEFGDRVTETRTKIQTVTSTNNTQIQVEMLHLLTSKSK
jgi:hypothetical protein